MSVYPKRVKIVEVGARDGLQNEKKIVPAADKIRFIDLLSESGLSVIEATSFVSPKWVPQLADASEVYAGIRKKPGVSYPVLVPNLKGLARAVEAGVKDIAVFTAASEGFNKKNINKGVEESLQEIRLIVAEAKEEGLGVRGYVSTCFVCPYEGKVAPEKVVLVAEALLKAGADEISIGDTTGRAVPEDVSTLFPLLLKTIPAAKLAVHFHDTGGRALDNMVRALEFGIATVDSSAGGLGGCPYAPGASGNVSTQAVLERLKVLGIETEINLKKVDEASQFIRRSL